ncbi:hypothetical protein CJ030_MR2G018633 [Morella rubra]|uniref:DUF629 domain-containing protein n=1 Tax=Morella rubra TaxID=262757 RepID=A0A6A1WCG0_9ROSI|nr:hypothetical protein CJ030_MR2G018633 [Morella rubra]
MALHERRKEVESRVIAARLLQEKKLAAFESCSQDNTIHGRRKYGKEVSKVTQIKSYWKETMSGENKRGLLKVRIEDLKAHFSKNKLAKDVLKEAIDFAMEQKKWKFCACCCCGHRSLDNDSNIGHLKSEHDMGSLSAMFEAYVPQVADDDCVDMVENGVWKPVDTVASIQIMEIPSRFESCDAVDSDSADKGIDNTQDCRSIVQENDPEVLLTEIDKFQRWPLCDDSKRTELLQRIHGALQFLLRNRCLSARHVDEVISFTIEMMITRIPFEHIDNEDLNATLLFTCFLEEAPHLESILEFLEELATSCGLGGLSGDHILDDKLRGPQEFCAKVRIVISADFSCLFLDERLLSEELLPTSFEDATADDGTALTSAVEIRESDNLPDGDAFVNWLMTGPPIREQLEAWASLKETGRTKGRELLKILEMEFNYLQRTIKTKRAHELYGELVEYSKGIFHQDYQKREKISHEFDPESSEPLLWKLQKDLEANGDPMIDIIDLETINSKFTLISDIFKEGQADSAYREERIQWLQGQLIKSVGILILAAYYAMISLLRFERSVSECLSCHLLRPRLSLQLVIKYCCKENKFLICLLMLVDFQLKMGCCRMDLRDPNVLLWMTRVSNATKVNVHYFFTWLEPLNTVKYFFPCSHSSLHRASYSCPLSEYLPSSVLQHHKLDARILAIMAIMRQTEQKLGVVSSYDYRSIMVHLLKSFMQAQVEHMFDKDTNEELVQGEQPKHYEHADAN